VAASSGGNRVGCQFHPELSGAYGAALLSRFLELR
jgi:imidazoleglycerol phosphate synthase glutamine amidotransferase subunit HisH